MAESGGPKNRGELRIHESLDELKTDLADYIAELSEASVKERGVFAIALSGGSLIGLMGKLCEAPYNKTVDWSKWYIFWADERVVAKNHADSNYKLGKEGLLSKIADEAFWGCAKKIQEINTELCSCHPNLVFGKFSHRVSQVPRHMIVG